ncbi:hypothetical protein D881_01900 [Corynebacterium ulcerans NCTC 12077]|nr:hypothetical protein D881_01900 [Corynebacterium ulcerans NCTC 12077]
MDKVQTAKMADAMWYLSLAVTEGLNEQSRSRS